MNQEKIGKFIRQKRKEKKITQAELASILGVSEKTISNWETGRNMPELSLFKPLADELDISINSLINGEVVDNKNYQEKLEETIINTIDYKDKKANNRIKKIIILVIFLFSFLIIYLSLKNINNLNLFDSYPHYKTVEIEKNKYDAILKESILSELQSPFYEDGVFFTAYKVFSIEEKGDNEYYIYTWVMEKEYTYKKKKLKTGSASSYPCRFKIKYENFDFKVIDKNIPGDGNLYVKDIEKYFPKYVRDKIYSVQEDDTFIELDDEILESARKYFKIKDNF